MVILLISYIHFYSMNCMKEYDKHFFHICKMCDYHFLSTRETVYHIFFIYEKKQRISAYTDNSTNSLICIGLADRGDVSVSAN